MRKFKTSISVGDNKLKDVAAGTELTDGVNFSQLLNNQIWTLHPPTDNIYYNNGRVGVNHDEQYLDSDQASEFNVLGSFSLKDASGNIIIGEEAKAGVDGNIIIGKKTGNSLPDAVNQGRYGRSNILLGHNAGYNMIASGNIVVGNNSGNGITGGNQNTLIGNDAGDSIGDNFYNVMIGNNSGGGVPGGNNTFVGHFSGTWCGAKDYSTLIGAGAGNFGFGINMIALGFQAASSVEDGDGMIAIGRDALRHSRGQNNLGIGYRVGFTLAGTGNIAYGNYANQESDIDHSITIGTSSGTNASGGKNIIVGHETGQFFQGANNTIIGNALLQRSNGNSNDSFTFNSTNHLQYTNKIQVTHGFEIGATISLLYVSASEEAIQFYGGIGLNDIVSFIVRTADQLESIEGILDIGEGNHTFYSPDTINDSILIGEGVEVTGSNQVIIGNTNTDFFKTGKVKIDAFTQPAQEQVMMYIGDRYQPVDINDYIIHPDIPEPETPEVFWEEIPNSINNIRNKNSGHVLIDDIKIDGDDIRMRDSSDARRLNIQATKISLGLNSSLQTLTNNLYSLNIHAATNFENLAKFQTQNRTGYLSIEQISANTLKFQLWQNNQHAFVINENRLVGIRKPIPQYELDIEGDMQLSGAFVDGLGSTGQDDYVLTSENGIYTRWRSVSDLGGGSSSLWLENGSTIYTNQQVAIGSNTVIGTSALTVHENSVTLSTTDHLGTDKFQIYLNNTLGGSMYYYEVSNRSAIRLENHRSNGDLELRINSGGSTKRGLLISGLTRRISYPEYTTFSDGILGDFDKVFWMSASGQMNVSTLADFRNSINGGGTNVAFQGSRSSSTSYTANVSQKINVSAQDYFIGSGFSTTTDDFTAPFTGVYQFHTRFKTSVVAGTYIIYRLQVNGQVRDYIMHTKVSNVTEEYVQFTSNEYLLPNETVEIYIEMTNTGNISDLKWSGHLLTLA